MYSLLISLTLCYIYVFVDICDNVFCRLVMTGQVYFVQKIVFFFICIKHKLPVNARKSETKPNCYNKQSGNSVQTNNKKYHINLVRVVTNFKVTAAQSCCPIVAR